MEQSQREIKVWNQDEINDNAKSYECFCL